MDLCGCYTFTETAAWCYLSLWFFVLGSHYSCLSQSYLSAISDIELWWSWLKSYCHAIDDHTFFSLSNVLETCWPSFKSFETEWETILAWCKSIALINHIFLFSESVSCLIVLHLKISVVRCFNIFGSVVICSIIFRLNIRNINSLW